MVVTAVVPIRSFQGMTRLSDELTSAQRRELSEHLATTVVDAASRAGLTVVVVSDDPEVREWASGKLCVIASDGDTGTGQGLNRSVTQAVAGLGWGAWIVLHADLPLIDPAIVSRVADEVAEGRSVVCPSLDGGTNAIAGWGPFDFAYGPGSFTNHLSKLPDAKVIVDRAIAIDIDTIGHYTALRTLGRTPSLAS